MTVGDLVRLLPLERGGISIVELTIPGESPWPAGRCTSCGCPGRHDRGDHPGGSRRDPQPETVITDGDEVIALTIPEAEFALRAVVVGEELA